MTRIVLVGAGIQPDLGDPLARELLHHRQPGRGVDVDGGHVDRAGNIYVTDQQHGLQKFDANGAFLTKWGGAGVGPGQFNNITAIATDTSGPNT